MAIPSDNNIGKKEHENIIEVPWTERTTGTYVESKVLRVLILGLCPEMCRPRAAKLLLQPLQVFVLFNLNLNTSVMTNCLCMCKGI